MPAPAAHPRPTLLVAAELLLLVTGCAGGQAAPGADESAAEVLQDLTLAELDQAWGCGEGFWYSDGAQQVALFVHLRDGAGPPPATGEVGGGWQVEVRLGSQLMANWCDDVLAPGEPTPQVHESLPGIAGTVTLTHGPPATAACPSEVVATLRGLVVADPSDGSRIELGDKELRNDTWGCFAG